MNKVCDSAFQKRCVSTQRKNITVFSVEVNEGYSNSQTSKIEERSHDIFGLIYRQATGVLEN